MLEMPAFSAAVTTLQALTMSFWNVAVLGAGMALRCTTATSIRGDASMCFSFRGGPTASRGAG